jgi:uncharacterized protein (TIGR02594 family)
MAQTTAEPQTDPLWLTKGRELVGLKEIVGSKHERKVLDFFAEAGHPEIHDDETAWCAAFANAMLRRAGYAGTGSLAARSFLNWGTKLEKPQRGCIVVFKRGNSEWQGHVAFFISDQGATVEVLGGNQGNSVSYARFKKSDVLDYRWPQIAGVPQKAPPILSAVRSYPDITATVFSDGDDVTGAYGKFNPQKPGVALTSHLHRQVCNLRRHRRWSVEHDRRILEVSRWQASSRAAVSRQEPGYLRPPSDERRRH